MFEFLKAAIRERGWSVPRFAREAHVSIGLVYKWLAEDPTYRITPGPKSCVKIATALGIDPDLLLDLAGHRPRRDTTPGKISAARQAVRDQLDRWMIAVGEDYEDEFWNYLKTHGDSGVALIQRIRTAVNPGTEAAVNAGVSGRSGRGRKRRSTGEGPLTKTSRPSHPVNEILDVGSIHANQRHAA